MGVVPLSARTVQNEAAVGVHRAASQHRLRGDVFSRRARASSGTGRLKAAWAAAY